MTYYKILKSTLLSLCFIGSNSLYAAPTTEKELDELFKVMKMEQIGKESLEQLKIQFQQQAYLQVSQRLDSEQLTSEQKEIVNKLSNKLFQHMEKYSSWNKIRPIYIKVYQDIFTSEEVQAQIDFYSSPIGQSILKKTPQVVGATSDAFGKQVSLNYAQDKIEINQILDELSIH